MDDAIVGEHGGLSFPAPSRSYWRLANANLRLRELYWVIALKNNNFLIRWGRKHNCTEIRVGENGYLN